MGSEQFYREERPVRHASVDGFWIEPTLVTNAQFTRFVEATGYVTLSERRPDPALYPDADPELVVPGSLVFRRTTGPVSLRDPRAWWEYAVGANWRHPQGEGSSIEGKENHPVVHVAYEDARAYVQWAGKALPTEAEWEFAARGGLDSKIYPWGDEPAPDDRMMANTWQGQFPWQNLELDGYEGTSPVGTYPANGYGLYDVVGNVWEWTTSRYEPNGVTLEKKSCCTPDAADGHMLRRVVKGGSHLCAPNYCLRYRPAARQGQTMDTATCHIGFRCIIRP